MADPPTFTDPGETNMTTAAQTPSRTKGFTTLFLIELWERFGYYGMTAVVVLFMVQNLGYTDDRANLTFGAFAALAYTVPAVGGWIGDKLLGSRRTMVLGALILALGYIGLSIPGHPGLLFPALAVVAVGGGIFKANPANMISKLYEGDSAKIDSAFTMYYMAVNLGAAASQIATPLIAVKIGWHAAFAVSAAGLVIGILNYFAMSRYLRHVGSEPDFQPLDVKRLVLVLLGIAVGIALVTFIVQNRTVARGTVLLGFVAMLAIFGVLMNKGTERERKGLIAVLILTALGMLFFIFYQQNVDVAHAVLAPQRPSRLLRVRRAGGTGPGAEPDLDLRSEPGPRLALYVDGEGRGRRLPHLDEVRDGLRGPEHRVLHLRIQRPLRQRGQGLVLVHDHRLRLPVPGRAAHQRPRPRDGRALRRSVAARVHHGHLVPRDRDLAVSRQLCRHVRERSPGA